jgi:homoserine O-acetyltransferase
MDHEIFHLGDFRTDAGAVLPKARLAYRTYGALNAARDNAIVLPSYYTGTHRSYEAMIGPGRALDPERWFIVALNAFGNGLSSSPSQARQGDFPLLTVADNVRAQHQLVVSRLGVRRVALACGWSMGAMQAYAWAALYPDLVQRLLPWCGSAQCWPLNRVFLEGLFRILDADPEPGKKAGLRAFGRSYAGWAYSAGFYRCALYRQLGHETLEDVLLAWEEDHAAWDVRDLTAMLETWRSAEPERLAPGADLAAYLGRVQARTVIMPCDRDAYFTLAEAEIEAALIPGARLEVIASDFGHCAGAPGREPAVTAQIDAALQRLLKE